MSKNIRMLTEAAIMIALAFVLSNIRIYELPNGGSITPGSMVPIILFAIRWTVRKSDVESDKDTTGIFLKTLGISLAVGAVEGAIQFILGPKWSMHPVSILFDYIIAYGVLGFAGIFGKKTSGIMTGVVLSVFLRFVCHVISGVVVFYEYAGTQNPWIYSILYNGSFLSIELVITILITLALIQAPTVLHAKRD